MFNRFRTFHCDVVLATFDLDETNLLLILKLFRTVRKHQVCLTQCCFCLSAEKNGRCLEVYVLQKQLLNVGLLVRLPLC